jgi:WD40 repeat protein
MRSSPSAVLAALMLIVVTTSLVAKHVTDLKGHKDPVYCVAFSPDGKTVASGGQNPDRHLGCRAARGPGRCLRLSPLYSWRPSRTSSLSPTVPTGRG